MTSIMVTGSLFWTVKKTVNLFGQSNLLILQFSTSHLFLAPANEVWGKVMFLHLSVSHSVQMGGEGGGVCPIACWDTPLWADIPGQIPPCRHPRADTPRQNPPLDRPPPLDTKGYGQQAGGTHPTAMHTCLLLFLLYPADKTVFFSAIFAFVFKMFRHSLFV